MAHPMQHHGEREKKPTTSGLYRKVDPGQPTPWWMVKVDGPVYRLHDNDPMLTGSLRDRFHMAASLLWARGLPPPTAVEIADAMSNVLVEVGEEQG